MVQMPLPASCLRWCARSRRTGTACKTDRVTIVRNRTNLGCAGGYNSGIHYAQEHFDPQYVLVVNNDVVCDAEMVAELVKAASSQQGIGIVGPKIFYYDWNGRRDIIWSAGGLIHRWGLKIHSQRGGGGMQAISTHGTSSATRTSSCASRPPPQDTASCTRRAHGHGTRWERQPGRSVSHMPTQPRTITSSNRRSQHTYTPITWRCFRCCCRDGPSCSCYEAETAHNCVALCWTSSGC